MIKPLWAGVAGVALLGTAGAGAFLVAGTGGEEEIAPAVQATATSTLSSTQGPSPSPAPTPTPGAPATVAATPAESPPPSPSPVPDDWLTYSDPEGRFTLRYPPDWFQDGEQFRDFDLAAWKGPSRKPETVVVEVSSQPIAQSSDCGGAQSLDPQTGNSLPRPGAVPVTFGGVPAWEIVRVQGDPAISEEDLTRIQGRSVVYKGTCFIVTGYWTQQEPDVEVFRQIASSFTFTY